jgi:ribonuclease HII
MKSDKLLPFAWRDLVPPPVIGVDEVGRGCLAGRVYAAAVILQGPIDEAYTDSKLLSEKRRDELSAHILMHHQVSIAFASVDEIDQINILQASLLAMHRAIDGLGVISGHVLIDGNQRIRRLRTALVQTTVIKGDLRAKPIAAASIVAKVARDRYMKELHERYPVYGFALHKGYSTPEHQEALRLHGPCDEHRKTFAGVREFFPPAQGVLL